MQKLPEYHIYFSVTGFGDDPTVITKIMGVEPTEAWIKGDPISRRGGKHIHSRWVIQSSLSLTEAIESHFENLLQQLEPLFDSIACVRTRYEARLACVAYSHNSNEGFRLSAETIRRISSLDLEIDFDLYFLGQ